MSFIDFMGNVEKYTSYTNEQLDIIKQIIGEKVPSDILDQVISPEISVDKLTLLYYYFRRRIPEDKIKKYFNGNYDLYKISELYLSYVNKIPRYLIDLYDREDFSSSLIESIRKCFFDKNNHIGLKEYLIENKYSEYEIYRRLKWLSRGFKKDTIDLFIKKGVHPHLSEHILTAIYENYPKEAIKILLIKDMPLESMSLIMNAFESKIPTERIKKYANPKYSPKLLELIFDALKYKLDDDMIQKFINITNMPNGGIKMALLEYESYILRNNIKSKLLKDVKDIKSYSMEIFETIFKFIYSGVSVDKINKYINPNMAADDIEIILYFMYRSMSDKLLEYVLSEQTKNIPKRLFIKTLDFKLSDDDIKSIFTPEYNQKQINVLCDIFSKNPPKWIKELLLNSKFSSDRMYDIFRSYCLDISKENIKKYIIDTQYHDLKINMIIELFNMGVCSNDSIEFIKSLPNLSYEQTQEVLLGIEHGLTEEQIRSYAKENIDENTMCKIRIAYMWDFPQKEIDKLLNK